MVEIGQAIARAREEKGLSLEYIAEQTRINIPYLHDLEQGNFGFLPRPYVVAYLKTVAGIVGLDGEALLRQWCEHDEARAAAQKAEAEAAQVSAAYRARKEPPPPKTYATIASLAAFPYLKEILIGLGLFMGMALLLYFSARPSKQANKQPPAKVEEIPFEQVAQETAAQQAEALPVTPQESAPPQRPMRLEIHAAGAAWVRVITDQHDTSEYSLRAGNVRAWQAQDQFFVRLGDAGAVKAFLDGKDLGEIGQSGQVASLMIGRDGIKEKRLRGRERQPANSPNASPLRADTTGRN